MTSLVSGRHGIKVCFLCAYNNLLFFLWAVMQQRFSCNELRDKRHDNLFVYDDDDDDDDETKTSNR